MTGNGFRVPSQRIAGAGKHGMTTAGNNIAGTATDKQKPAE